MNTEMNLYETAHHLRQRCEWLESCLTAQPITESMGANTRLQLLKDIQQARRLSSGKISGTSIEKARALIDAASAQASELFKTATPDLFQEILNRVNEAIAPWAVDTDEFIFIDSPDEL